ncbi:MAG: lysylphosphatidylglycerol synthase transmembrane domain-containing protein [Chloroflexota bacterium]
MLASSEPSETQYSRSLLPTIAVGILITALSFIYLASRADLGQVFEQIKTVRVSTIFYIVVGQTVYLLLRAIRWKVILSEARFSCSFWSVFHGQNLGFMVNNLFPLRIGELVRVFVLTDRSIPSAESFGKCTTSIILERILDVMFTFLLLGLLLVIAPIQSSMLMVSSRWVFILGAIGLMIVAYIALRLTPISSMLDRYNKRTSLPIVAGLARLFHGSVNAISSLRSRRSLVTLIALTIVTWCVILFTYWHVLSIYWQDTTWIAAAVTIVAVNLSIAIPSTPGAVGIFHAAVVAALRSFDLSTDQAFTFAIVMHAVIFLTTVAFGITALVSYGLSLGSLIKRARLSAIL